MSLITTHVLDTSEGRPASGVPVFLEVQTHDGWHELGRAVTDAGGRVHSLMGEDHNVIAGNYRLTFDTAEYLARFNVSSFFPEIAVLFEVQDTKQHYHVPLLLSPFGYSTYRGT